MLFKTSGLAKSSSPEFNLFSDIEEHSEEEETIDVMIETMEQYMSKTHGNYGFGVVRPKINDKTHFELKGKFLKELRENTFSDSEHEDANEHIEKVLEIVDLFHIPKVNEKVYTTQDKYELGKGPHYTKDCPLKEEGKILEAAYYIPFGAPYQPGGQYRAESITRKRNRKSAWLNRTKSKGHVKSISTAKADSFMIRHILSGPYAVSDTQYSSISSKIVSFPNSLHAYCCDDWKEAREVKILETYDHTLPQKEKDP
uniref:Uncharacterized protein n=1 Tax=Tanacetum cinerariifolium TaxID=118510 RepID=A0A6L2JFX1_TANCI|nr:hypothetical protein [Tanacetum cinerariifolium]